MNSFDSDLISRLTYAIRHRHLFNPGDTLIVALSGGADSCALLDLLTRLHSFNLRLVVAHLNHCLRGDASDADEEFCRNLAARYDLSFEVRRVDVGGVAAESRLNLEDAGRRIRIGFLDEMRRNHGASAVLLAHHADDQAETVLMRLLRGSGMTGLSGMAYRNKREYVRPLLEISRSDIEQYLRGRGLEWREDASNSDMAYLRNRIRHQLLPLLEEYNPAIRSSLAATAAVLGDEDRLLEELSETAFVESHQIEEGRVAGTVSYLRTLNPALRRRVVRHAIKRLTGTLEGISLRHLEAVCAMIDADRSNARLALPHGVAVVREYDRLVWLRTDDEQPAAPMDVSIPGPGSYQLPDGRLIVVEMTDTAHLPTDSGTACFNLAKAPFPWEIRAFRAGDRMVPFGMSGRKKVKDIYIDRKIPLSERARIPLLWCGDDLIWVAGVCVSELSRIDAASVATVRVTWHSGG